MGNMGFICHPAQHDKAPWIVEVTRTQQAALAVHTERQAAAEQGDGTGCPALRGTPRRTTAGGDGTWVWRRGFVDVIGVNHSLFQLNQRCIHWVSPGVSPPWLSPRKFPFPLILGETICGSIPSALSHGPVRAQGSPRCPSASTQPLSRCPASPVGPVLKQGHLE